jgi:hypothetical protein
MEAVLSSKLPDGKVLLLLHKKTNFGNFSLFVAIQAFFFILSIRFHIVRKMHTKMFTISRQDVNIS